MYVVLGSVLKEKIFSRGVVTIKLVSFASRVHMGQFDEFARGEIVGMARVGTSTADTRNAVRKANGKKPSIRAVQQVIAKKKSCPLWRGAREKGSGRPPAMSAAQQKDVVRLVFKYRGTEVVTRAFCQQHNSATEEVQNPRGMSYISPGTKTARKPYENRTKTVVNSYTRHENRTFVFRR